MSALRGRRVVLALNWADLGGAERNALTVAERLRDEHGAEVEVLALTTREGRAKELFGERGFPWHGRDLQWYGNRLQKGALLARLVRELRARRPDVLLPYCTPANVLCGLTWRPGGAATCVWNQRDVNPSRRFGMRLIGTALRQTPLAIANSRAARDFLVTEWGAEPARVHVVIDPVEPLPASDDRAAWRARLGLDESTVVACMVAHLHEYKDHATLLRAWERLRAEGVPAVLLLAGRDAGAEPGLKALAYDLELGASVRFLGDVRDMGGLLAASDIGVLCSRRESAPRAVLEMMAAGLPVAGSDIPGLRELVGSGDLLAPPGDAAGLARILRDLVADPARRHSAGAGSEAAVRERHARASGAAEATAVVAAAYERTRG